MRGTGRRRRARRYVVTTGVVVVLAWLVTCFVVVQHPHIDRPGSADAVLILGPTLSDRVNTGLTAIRRHLSDQLVVSIPDGSNGKLCRLHRSGLTVTCFVPHPSTTRGEAEELGRLAARHHWTSVIVVTSKYHVSRARMIISRCFHGRLSMVAAGGSISFVRWAYEYVYQTAGYVKAALYRSC